MAARVMVTGATGFVGRPLVVALRAVGHTVFTLSQRQAADHQCAIDDAEGLAALVEKLQPDVVVHLAAKVTGARDPALVEEMYRVHVSGTHALIGALQPRAIPLVMAGSYAELGTAPAPYTAATAPQPVSPYGSTKLIATEIARMHAQLSGARVCVLRAANLYGPGQRDGYFIPSLLQALLADQPFAMSLGEQRRDFLYLTDFVDALVCAVGLDGHGFTLLHVGSGEALRLRDIAEEVQRVCGRSGLLRFGAKPYRRAEAMDMRGDITEARRLLGWAPKHSLAEGLQHTLDALCGAPTRAALSIAAPASDSAKP